jgi:hypothetical protein
MLASGIEPGATPEHSNLKAVGRRGHNPSSPIHVTGWQAHNVLAKYDIGFRKSFEEAVINHGLRALCRLLARLKNCHQSSLPATAALGKEQGGSYQASHVHVVSAGVGCRHAPAIRAYRCY